MPSLYSYCIPFDDGAAPNPFWGVCTLTICKPAVRRTASCGDWIIGLGSKDTPTTGSDFSGKVVYIMKITDKKSLLEYDIYCRKYLPRKIPDWNSKETILQVGDCIYDYSHSNSQPTQRNGVHKAGNISTDLSGQFALLSSHFYYFGRNPIDLPQDLHPIILQSQGHRRQKNDPYFKAFIEWENTLKYKPCSVISLPEMWGDNHKKPSARSRCSDDDNEV